MNLREFNVNEHNIQACVNPEDAVSLQEAILNDLKVICEDEVNFPLLATINLDNNGYNEGGSVYQRSQFADALLVACQETTRKVEISAWTDLSVQYDKMCGTPDKSYGYYDLTDEREIAQCRFTWHWELKDGSRQYGEQGPFPSKENPRDCTTSAPTEAPATLPPPTSYDECWSEEPVSNYITELVIGSNTCNANTVTALDLTKYPLLKSVTIGDESFMYVNEVSIIGLRELESVQIGENCFTTHKNGYGTNSNGRFYLKNCPKFKSLKIGRNSFSDYSVCEIENVNALESIEMGDLNDMDKYSWNFLYASLELKGFLIREE